MLDQQVVIEDVVCVGEQDFGAAIAALGHMMRQAGNDNPSKARHRDADKNEPAPR